MTLTKWKQEVSRLNPTAQFTQDDGTGNTYADEVGDWTAHTGPDMQADVVGVYNPGRNWWFCYGPKFEDTYEEGDCTE